MKVNKYAIIAVPIVYIILGYTLFTIKYTSIVDTPVEEVFINKFISSVTHLWHIKLLISLIIAIMINTIISKRKSE